VFNNEGGKKMKKFSMLSITALAVLFVCVLTGCSSDDDGGETPNGGETPSSMTFVDNPDAPAKEFTIYSDFNFKVTFIKPNAIEDGLGIVHGEVISGKITDADAAWNSSLTGSAAQMSSTNATINSAVKPLNVAVSLTYTENAGAITAVELKFTGTTSLSATAEMLMGATYYKK
jgi:hypothetical protein